MDKTDWLCIIVIVFLVCVTALGVTGTIPTEDIKELFIFIVTAILGVVGGYAVGKHKGYWEGKSAL